MIIGSIKSITLEDQCSLERDRNLVLRLSLLPRAMVTACLRSCWGPCLVLWSYCSQGLCWCLWPEFPTKATRLPGVQVATSEMKRGWRGKDRGAKCCFVLFVDLFVSISLFVFLWGKYYKTGGQMWRETGRWVVLGYMIGNFQKILLKKIKASYNPAI